MSSSNLYLTSLLLFLLVQCHNFDHANENSTDNTFKSFPNRSLINGTVLTDSDSLVLPLRISFLADYLIVVEDKGHNAIKVFGARDGNFYKSFGLVGHGPGEYIGAFSIDVSPFNKEFLIYDITLSRLTLYTLDSLLTDTSYNYKKIIKLNSDRGITVNVSWLAKDNFVSSGYYRDGRLCFFNPNGQNISITGSVPSGRKSHVPITVHQHAYQSYLAVRPDLRKIVLATRYADQLEIYSESGNIESVAKGPHRFSPAYQLANARGYPTLEYTDKTRFGYIDLVATNNFIYGLYSGERRNKSKDSHAGQFINVFDWEGQPVYQYKLDRKLFSIALDAKNDVLYGISHDPVPSIVKFPLLNHTELPEYQSK